MSLSVIFFMCVSSSWWGLPVGDASLAGRPSERTSTGYLGSRRVCERKAGETDGSSVRPVLCCCERLIDTDSSPDLAAVVLVWTARG
ncbi:MAG TPA: hypothetical protein VIT41_11390 [Microlunatus sp.]